MVRLARERPRSLARAASISLRLDNRRRPETFALARGTRRVIRSLSKCTTKTLSVWPAISCVSIPSILPTPWVGYTTRSPAANGTFSEVISVSHNRTAWHRRDASARRRRRRPAATVDDLTRRRDASPHQRQNTVKSLFEASGSVISGTNRIWSAQPFALRYLPQLGSARIGGKILVVLVGDVFPLISVDGIGFLARDVGPYRRVFPVEL